MKMKAAVFREAGRPIKIEEVNLAPPKEKEILVKTKFTGFCHSDFAVIAGQARFPFPSVIGHEAAGIVVDVGAGVTSVQKGDHVVGSWSIPCGKCKMCVSGRSVLCTTSRAHFMTGSLLDGTSRLTDAAGETLCHQTCVSGFAEYMVLPEEGAIKMRKDLPLYQACLMGCCMPTGLGAVYNTAGVKPCDSVAIWGMGGVGLNVVQGAKVVGAYPIIGVDIEGSKEAIAREFGATHFINSSKEDPVPKIQELTDGGADFVFEVTGDVGAIVQVYWAMGVGGKHIQVGVPSVHETVSMQLTYTPGQHRDIIGCLFGDVHVRQDLPKFADMVMNGNYINLDKLITKKFKLEELSDVFDAMGKHQIIGRWVCEFD
jgi:S-(hydroxymethyl)glutathione dehydrogenase/alcohol dehydrogenase